MFRGFLARRNTAFIMKSKRVSYYLTILIHKNLRLIQDILQSMNPGKQYQKIEFMIPMQKEKKEIYTHSKQAQHMKVNGLEDSEMDMEYNNGLMVQDMKVNGEIIEPMEKENSHISTEIFMRGIGSMIKQTDMEFIII